MWQNEEGGENVLITGARRTEGRIDGEEAERPDDFSISIAARGGNVRGGKRERAGKEGIHFAMTPSWPPFCFPSSLPSLPFYFSWTSI